MKGTVKKIAAAVLAGIIAIVLLITACGNPSRQHNPMEREDIVGETEKIDLQSELWVMYNRADFTQELLEAMAELFSAEHPETSVRLEQIPTDENMLQRLRTQIMAGNGPDAYILKSDNELFPDVYQSMYNGLFEDISGYYDSDTQLGKDALHTGIMNAGVINEGRYVLPLRFDFPVAYVDVEQFESLGGSLDMIEGGIINIFDNFLDTQNPNLISGVTISNYLERVSAFNFLPNAIDYDVRQVLLTTEDVALHLRSLQKVRAIGKAVAAGNDSTLFCIRFPFHFNENIVGLTHSVWPDHICMYIGRAYGLLTSTVYEKISGKDIEMIPIAAADGDLVADVTHFAAIGYGCDDPGLAYEFIRLFLTEEGQYMNCQALYSSSGMYMGWPVRIEGSINGILDIPEVRNRFREGINRYKQKSGIPFATEIEIPSLSEEDIQFLNVEFNRITYSSSMEIEFWTTATSALNDANTYEALDVDIDTIALEFVDELKWHLAEG